MKKTNFDPKILINPYIIGLILLTVIVVIFKDFFENLFTRNKEQKESEKVVTDITKRTIDRPTLDGSTKATMSKDQAHEIAALLFKSMDRMGTSNDTFNNTLDLIINGKDAQYVYAAFGSQKYLLYGANYFGNKLTLGQWIRNEVSGKLLDKAVKIFKKGNIII